MLNYEFDLETAKEVWKEEAMEQSTEEGIRSLMANLKLSLNQAMDALNIPTEKQPMYAARIQKQ